MSITLDKEDVDRVQKFYGRAYKAYGVKPEALYWCPVGQRIRFRIFAEEFGLNLDKASVLDNGCGFGDFFKFLTDRDLHVRYTGVDLMPHFIVEAKKKYTNATLINADIATLNNRTKYDYVFASGSLTFKVKGNDTFYQGVIEKMWKLSKKAISFNMLSLRDRYHRSMADSPTYAFYDPDRVEHWCKKITRNVKLRHDYLGVEDFTVFMYK